MDWPDRGVYFFLEPGETRDSPDQMRVTRIGTHAVSGGSSTSLWDRFKQHYGTGSGSSNHPHHGNHRGSVYRKRVGEAIIEQNAIALLSNFDDQTVDPRDDGWLGKYSRSREIRESGLWNVNHVEERYDLDFLDMLGDAAEDTTPP
jgi:hypothetical protein